jgi:DNA-binding phage protein
VTARITPARITMSVPQYRRSECSVDGRPVHLFPQSAELVALLLVSPPDRCVPYDLIIEAVWPDPDSQALTAVHVLHVMVTKLRHRGVHIFTEWGRGLFLPAECRGERARHRRLKYRPRTEPTPDARDICAILRDEIVRTGWSETARRAGVERTALHRAFQASPGKHNPSFATVTKTAQALGLEFTVRRKAAS